MFDFKVTIQAEGFDKLLAAERKASADNLAHAAAAIRKTEIESIHFGQDASEPGTPPHTHGRRLTRKGKPRKGQLQRAILFDVDKTALYAVIGPRFSVVGTSAAAHEFGGEYKGEQYPARPFAEPALENNLDRFLHEWQYSIGE